MNVDIIGIEGVCKFIQTSKLNKFIVFRQHARSGSTPVYDASHCGTTAQAISTFRDWAQNLLSGNPANSQSYELLLFAKLNDIENDLDADDDDTPAKNKKGIKMKKVRVSFALAAGGYMQGNTMNVQEAVKAALAERDTQDSIKALTAQVSLLTAKLNGEVDNDDEDDADEEEDTLTKAFHLVKEINRNEMIKRGHYGKVAGDDDDEFEDDDDSDVQVKSKKSATMNADDELIKIKKALKRLRKHMELGRDLTALANFADKNPTMFKNYLETLRKGS